MWAGQWDTGRNGGKGMGLVASEGSWAVDGQHGTIVEGSSPPFTEDYHPK
jgi:hypothetical protein